MPWTWLAGRLCLSYQSVHQHNNPARLRIILNARVCQWHPIPFQYRFSSSRIPRHRRGQCHFKHQSYSDQGTPYTSCTSQVSSTLSCSFELRLWISWIARWTCLTMTLRVYSCFEARTPRFVNHVRYQSWPGQALAYNPRPTIKKYAHIHEVITFRLAQLDFSYCSLHLWSIATTSTDLESDHHCNSLSAAIHWWCSSSQLQVFTSTGLWHPPVKRASHFIHVHNYDLSCPRLLLFEHFCFHDSPSWSPLLFFLLMSWSLLLFSNNPAFPALFNISQSS